MKLIVTRYEYPCKEGRGLKIAQVSDLHNEEFKNDELLHRLCAEKPDLIAVTGDFFNRHRPYDEGPALSFFREAAKRFKVFCIEGNHEREIGERLRWREKFATMGAIVLDNAFVDLTVGDCRLRIAGAMERAAVESIAAMQTEERLTVTLSHRAERFEDYVAAGCRLTLCGHAHGGQMRPFGIGLYSPEQGVFPKYTKGVYRRGATTMIVSTGLGNTVGVPRLWNPRELVLISLR
ncbi:MAG: metallophosphoesterase [Clostridia bacterium]|nr:metallophosphoesterase [Clostridia bacterium]